MQSQQKRVKWSRGETAEALEERTDTGITQASVELMKDCIPDIYGNISRRPSLKPIPLAVGFTSNETDPTIYRPISQKTGWNNIDFLDDKILQVIPFYISEDDIILICVNSARDTFLRIKNGEIVYEFNGSSSIASIPSIITGYYGSDGILHCNKVSYAQQNNYLVIATDENVYKVQFEFGVGDSFTPNIEIFDFSANWYAPNGTQTKSVDSSMVAGLNFTSNSIKNYIFTESDGQTIVYSSIKTGISLAAVSNTWTGATTTFYIHVRYPSSSSNRTIYIDTNSSSSIGNFTMTNGTSYSNGQVVCTYSRSDYHDHNYSGKVKVRITGSQAYFYFSDQWGANYEETYDVSSYFTNNPPQLEEYIPVGSIVQFPANGAYMRVEGYDSDGTDLIMYGALLTPVADNNASDTSVNVEYGYISLTPENFAVSPEGQLFPHPTKLCFESQRLWAGGWAWQIDESYALVIGSQIARYNDFKNDYNQENEAITLDILTQFKEKITHLIDYNGLKIFTDSFEYAYNGGGVVKQSANGSLDYCEPIVFESLCLYADSTGNQIRAMQYEFQSNIFNSSCINQLASHDLIWYPRYMAAYEDKTNSTGKYLFIINTPVDNDSLLAVCNFVPSNQANIWNRWTFPQLNWVHGSPQVEELSNMIHSVLNTKTNPIFLIKSLTGTKTGDYYGGFDEVSLTPCLLDFEGNLDLEGTITADNEFVITRTQAGTAPYIDVVYQSLAKTEIAIYSNGEFQFTTTTDKYGKITNDLSGLTNITAGLMINSKIVSHPIDVGGKTKSVKKRIGKAQMSVHDTPEGAITINGKTGYMNPAQDHICFYGVSGMKDEVKYTITNKNGAMFHLESLLMNIEYGTLDS